MSLSILSTVLSQWSKLEPQGPPPASRLDFGMCVLQLRRTLVTTDTDVASTTKQAKEVLEREMAKPGSATSRSSCPELSGNGDYTASSCVNDTRVKLLQ